MAATVPAVQCISYIQIQTKPR